MECNDLDCDANRMGKCVSTSTLCNKKTIAALKAEIERLKESCAIYQKAFQDSETVKDTFLAESQRLQARVEELEARPESVWGVHIRQVQEANAQLRKAVRKLSVFGRRLATEANMFQCDEGDGMRLADAITAFEQAAWPLKDIK